MNFELELAKEVEKLVLQGYDRKEILEGAKDLIEIQRIKDSWEGFRANLGAR